MNFTEIWNHLEQLAPPDYARVFSILILMRVLDSITAYLAVKREARIAEREGRTPVIWKSHTFTEKLFIKFSMYIGLLAFGWFIWRQGIGSWGLTFAMAACLYAEAVSLYENTTRAGIKWPAVFEAAKKAIETKVKAFIKK